MTSLPHSRELGPRIGHGGMNEVYQTRAPSGRDEAVIVPHHGSRTDPEFINREARLVRVYEQFKGVEHPNLLRVYGLQRISQRDCYGLLVELIAGGTLAGLIEQRPLLPEEVEALAEGASRGLGFLHAKGCAYRDLKPSNILLRPGAAEGVQPHHVVLGDLQGVLDRQLQPRLTAAHGAIGTLLYLPPEALRGRQTPAGDVYTLGLLTSELFGGRLPLQGSVRDLEEARMRLEEWAWDRPERCPEELWGALILPSLDLDPRKRPSAEKWMEVLQRRRAARAASRTLSHSPPPPRDARKEPAMTQPIQPRFPERRTPRDFRDPSRMNRESAAVLFAALVVVVGFGILARLARPGLDLPPPNLEVAPTDLPKVVTVPPTTPPTPPPGFVEIPAESLVAVTCTDIGDCETSAREIPRFFLARTETTQGAFARCVEAGSCRDPSEATWTPQDTPDHPVTGVSRQDARDYCRWLAPGGRLPSEQEWERAGQGDDHWTFAWGDASPALTMANISKGRNKNKILPVGTAADGSEGVPGPFGTLDQSGSVWEWVETPSGEGIYKGGSTESMAQHLQIEARGYNDPDYRGSRVGFRCAWSSVAPEA